MNDTVYILDSYGLIFRCYFAFVNRPLTNKQGQNISAVFGFFRNLHFIFEHYNPSCLIAAMDSKTKTFRHEMFSEYKATRNKTPDDLHAQVPWITEILETMGVPVLQCDGYEADDIIATVAKKCEKIGRQCRILSGDKDLMQLVTENTNILKPENGGWKLTKTDGVQAEWGVEPKQILDLLSLFGDSSDNIPGVHGVGVKTAAKLLSEYNDIDGIYANIEKIKGAMQKKLIDGKENAYFSQKLVRLEENVPCPSIDSLLSKEIDYNFSDAGKILEKYGAFAVAKSYFELGDKNASPFKKTTLPHAEKLSVSSGKNEKNAAKKSNEDNATDVQEECKKNHGEYSVITHLEELESFVNAAINEKVVAFDSETTSLDTMNTQIVGFSLCVQAGKAVYVPLFTTNIFENADFIPKEKAFSELLRLFENPEITVIFHNGKFDYKVLRSNGMSFKNGKPDCKIFDTMVAGWLLSPDRTGKNSYGLEYMAERYLHLKGIEYSEIVPKGQNFSDIELERATPYAAEDADFTYQLWAKTEKMLKEQNLYELFVRTEMQVLPILAEMEIAGIHLNPDALNKYNEELSAGIEEAEKAIYEEVGHSFNIASPKQLQTVLFEERKLKPGKKTKTGFSTDTAVLEELSMYDSVPKMILEFRELSKLKSTYVETLPKLCDKNQRIHTDFVQT